MARYYAGKIMRRILRKIAAGEEDSIGDVSTLADPLVVPKLVESFKMSVSGDARCRVASTDLR
jgi:acetyl-CoA synthetase